MVTSGLRPNAAPIRPSALHFLQVGMTFDYNLLDAIPDYNLHTLNTMFTNWKSVLHHLPHFCYIPLFLITKNRGVS